MDFLFANQGIALAVLGYFGFILKDLPARIWALIRQHWSITIQSNSEDNDSFQLMNRWIFELYPSMKAHVQFRHKRMYYNDDAVVSQVADGSYFLLLDWCTYALLERRTLENRNYIVYGIVMRIVGKNRNKYNEQYNKYLEENLQTHANELMVHSRSSDDRVEESFVPKKSLDDVFFARKKELTDYIDLFLNNKKFYRMHGIVYKIGIIFYGPPGSGKTTLARAIATRLGWDINYVDLKSTTNLPKNASKQVIIFEDIDCLVGSRDESVGVGKELSKIGLHTLLNYLDGFMSPNNCIFIATTNHIEAIDKALVRPGRFDLCIEVPYIGRDLAKEMCDRYGIGYGVLDNIVFPVSPAIIQNRIVQEKNEKRPV